jgi:hypothetical protein
MTSGSVVGPEAWPRRASSAPRVVLNLSDLLISTLRRQFEVLGDVSILVASKRLPTIHLGWTFELLP